jgi:hypothetical protein
LRDETHVTTLIFDTALALPFGNPRQRAAEALRVALSASGEVRMVTLDPWGTEWSARMRMAMSDRLLPGRRMRGDGAKHFFALPGRASGRFPSPAEVQGGDDPFRPWLPARRIEKLAAIAQRLRPDRIILADPILAPLAAPLWHGGVEMMLFGGGQAAWHREAARRVADLGASQWHTRLAALLAEDRHMNQPWAQGLMSSDHDIPLPFAFDDAFLDKSSSVVALSTGVSWLDRMSLEWLRDALGALGSRQLAIPEVVLIGFAPDLTQAWPDAVVQEDWAHLVGLVGGARVLWLPWLAPDLVRVAKAALALGTPVLVHPRDAALWQIEDREGLMAIPPSAFARVLAGLLDPSGLGSDDYRRIAEMAQAADEVQRARSAERLGIGALSSPPLPRLRRVPVMLGEPEVVWNPLSRLVLARLQLRGSTGVEEVRLLDGRGTELNRLFPSEQQKRLRRIVMEGGVIARPEDLHGSLHLQVHAAEGILAEAMIPVDRFRPLEAEIAMLQREGPMLHGAFWALGENQRPWSIGVPGFQMGLSSADTRPMPEIGGVAVSFSVPLPLAPRSEVSLWRRGTGRFAAAEPSVQRPVPVTPLLAQQPGPPSRAIQKLRNIHEGRRGWIIGNGPSVRLEDLAAIPAGDVVFCFNRFYLSHGDHPLRETYVVSADTLMIRDFGQEMIDRSPGLALFCLPGSMMPPLRGAHVHLTPGDNPLPLFSLDPGHFVSVGGSSVFVAFQMAHWMGIRDVVLYGMDYSFSMTLRRDPRFPFPVSFEDGNHFIPSYRGAKPWCPPTWRDISAAFLNARVAFETTGGRVVNATRGGRLETFPRRDFDEVLRDGRA